VSDDGTPYLFDARSGSWPRTTGWERYTREIAERISQVEPRVRVRVAGSQGVASRLWQDLVATPGAVRGTRIAHFPTLPPVPWARPRTALVFTLHDLTWWRWRETASRMGRHYYAPLAAAALRRPSTHVVVGTTTVRDEVVDHFGLDPDSVSVVPLGVELPAPARVQPRSRPYVLTVGTLEPRKNLPRLVQAYQDSGLSKTHDLLVVGRMGWGERPAGMELISGVGDAELVSIYQGAAALLLPSLYEGFGLPAVEAMQLGVPVICADIPVLREVTGGRATYVDATDGDVLVDALRSAPDAAAPAGAADWAVRTYTWGRAVQMLCGLYRDLDGRIAS
jgi:glycosyltransferase involved in cell wall biosynthesis